MRYVDNEPPVHAFLRRIGGDLWHWLIEVPDHRNPQRRGKWRTLAYGTAIEEGEARARMVQCFPPREDFCPPLQDCP